MNMITIKPHHFMDIIKLYGTGIEKFVPDYKYNHDFYIIGNEIIKNHNIIIKTTINEDDICLPCKYIGTDGICSDCINHISSITSKDAFNKTLDTRILYYANNLSNNLYSANNYCQILYLIKENIFDIWKEEPKSSTINRYNNFCNGAKKYLGL